MIKANIATIANAINEDKRDDKELKVLHKQSMQYKLQLKEIQERDQKRESQIKELDNQDELSEVEMQFQEQQKGASANTNPQLMDVQMVIKMFREIKQQMDKIERSNQEKDISVKQIQDEQNKKGREIIELRKEVRKYKVKSEVLSGVRREAWNAVCRY